MNSLSMGIRPLDLEHQILAFTRLVDNGLNLELLILVIIDASEVELDILPRAMLARAPAHRDCVSGH